MAQKRCGQRAAIQSDSDHRTLAETTLQDALVVRVVCKHCDQFTELYWDHPDRFDPRWIEHTAECPVTTAQRVLEYF